MNKLDEDLKKILQKWQVEPTDSYAVSQIVLQATKLQQKEPVFTKIQNALVNALSDWQFGLTYKLASFAVCAVIGFGIGVKQIPEDNNVPSADIAAIAFGQMGNGEEL